MQTKLTQAVVERLIAAPPDKDTTIFDTELKRFALRAKPGKMNAKGVQARPSMWFFIRYVSPVTGLECRMSVAKAVLKVDAARKAARVKLALVDQGRDPAAERATLIEVPTIKALVASYIESAEFKRKTAKVQANDRARLDHHIVNRVGSKKADAVTQTVARGLVREITADTRTGGRSKKLGGPGAARKSARLLAAVLAWGKDEGLIQDVPFTLKGLKLEGDGQRDATITSVEEYGGLFATMADMVAEGTLRADVRAFLVLVASTGLRRGEAQALTWGQVNLERRQITLAGSKCPFGKNLRH